MGRGNPPPAYKRPKPKGCFNPAMTALVVAAAFLTKIVGTR